MILCYRKSSHIFTPKILSKTLSCPFSYLTWEGILRIVPFFLVVAKKRCLFVEEEQVEPIEESVSGLVGRKSVKEVKKSMRGKARKKHRELLPVSLAAEIDFPQEWVVAGSQEAKGMAETQDAERLSGCPPTATKEL